jgi:hypothetical protein
MFENSIPVFFVLDGNVTSATSQAQMLDFYHNVESMDFVDSPPTFWFLNFQSWLKFVSSHSRDFSANGSIVPEDKFFDWVSEFLSSTGRCHQPDVILDQERRVIIASRLMASNTNMTTSTDFVKSINDAESLCSQSPISSYVRLSKLFHTYTRKVLFFIIFFFSSFFFFFFFFFFW